VPVVNFSRNRLMNAFEGSPSSDEVAHALAMLGCVPEETGAEWAVEVFPDRPDLLSAELLGRALRAYMGDEPELTTHEVASPGAKLVVEDSVEPVRPVIVGARATGLQLTDDTLTSLMDLQEDLHWGLGARRRKVSVGIHDASSITPPFTYRAVDPDATSFVPLKGADEMTMREMTAKLEKGVEYAHLVEDYDEWPLIVDDDGQVLSFPPIINGTETTVTADTEEVFVDVTGQSERGCREVLNVVLTQLAELGGKLEAVTVSRPDETVVTPDLEPSRHAFGLERARDLLGKDFSVDEASQALKRMGHGVADADGDTIEVDVAAWRSDVLHKVDLIEDVAIGLCYDRFDGTDPQEVTFGSPSAVETFDEQLRSTLTGYGYLECMTLTLRSREEQTDLIGADDELIAVENPVSHRQEVLRRRLLPGLIDLAAENTHRDLPQKLFETGDVIVPSDDGGPTNRRRVAGLIAASDAGFTRVKSHVEGLFGAIGRRLNVEAADRPGFVEGRCATAIDAETGRELGVFGEVHPATLEAVDLTTPCAGFELAFVDPADASTWSADDEHDRVPDSPTT